MNSKIKKILNYIFLVILFPFTVPYKYIFKNLKSKTYKIIYWAVYIGFFIFLIFFSVNSFLLDTEQDLEVASFKGPDETTSQKAIEIATSNRSKIEELKNLNVDFTTVISDYEGNIENKYILIDMKFANQESLEDIGKKLIATPSTRPLVYAYIFINENGLEEFTKNKDSLSDSFNYSNFVAVFKKELNDEGIIENSISINLEGDPTNPDQSQIIKF